MVVLPPTGALRYHNCGIDGGTSPENFGYHPVLLSKAFSLCQIVMTDKEIITTTTTTTITITATTTDFMVQA
jgi:hypothetical protein